MIQIIPISRKKAAFQLLFPRTSGQPLGFTLLTAYLLVTMEFPFAHQGISL